MPGQADSTDALMCELVAAADQIFVELDRREQSH